MYAIIVNKTNQSGSEVVALSPNKQEAENFCADYDFGFGCGGQIQAVPFNENLSLEELSYDLD